MILCCRQPVFDAFHYRRGPTCGQKPRWNSRAGRRLRAPPRWLRSANRLFLWTQRWRISCLCTDESMPETCDILVVIAHPDDEVFVSGTICLCAEKGFRIVLVSATDGEGGSRDLLFSKSGL